MSERYPGIQVPTEDGPVLVRNGLIIRFYMHRSHQEFASGVVRALDTYLRAVGPHTLAWYPDMEGDWQSMNDSAWKRTRQELLDDEGAFVTLTDNVNIYKQTDFQFQYAGISLEDPGPFIEPGHACVVTFWLPTTFMEQRGPGQARELALELASHLPFNSGYASLAFNTFGKSVDVTRPLQKRCFRYPGVDVLDERVSRNIGTRIPGAYWLTFLGQPVLGDLGGVEGLRARLSSPDTSVQPLVGDSAVVTLGQWPEAGDVEAGKNLPEYRELARVLEPWLYHRGPDSVFDPDFPPGDWLRWERRFLD